MSIDLGYRWLANSMSTDEVLGELLVTCSPEVIKQIANEDLTCERELAEQRYHWRRAGEAFDWCIGGHMPNLIKCEVVKIEASYKAASI